MSRQAYFKMSSMESITDLMEGLMDTAKLLMRKIDQNPAEIAAKEADLTHIREHLKRLLWNNGLTLEEALKKVLVFYYLSQRKFVSDNHIWQKWISCWDYNLRQLCAIFAYMKRLPPGTIILSPIAGNCLLEAVLERMGFTVISNDIKPNGFTFHSPGTTVTHKDGLHFLQDFVKENPGHPFVLLMSWAPQAEAFDLFSTGQKSSAKDCSSISVQVMEFAAKKSHNCQCVFHISEGRGGCTDVNATFDVIDSYFREIWRIGRYPSFYEKPKIHNPINDQLSCLYLKKRE